MYASRFKKRLIVGFVACSLLALLLGLLSRPGFDTRWRNLRPGMTQMEVRKTLGSPARTGKTEVIGAGGRNVTSWEYKRGLWKYCVDFDYIGPGGTPLAYRFIRFREEWSFPPWWPWKPRAKA